MQSLPAAAASSVRLRDQQGKGMNSSPAGAGTTSQPCFWGSGADAGALNPGLGFPVAPWVPLESNPAPPEGNKLIGIGSVREVLLGTAWRCWEGGLGGKSGVQRALGGYSCSWPWWEGMERGWGDPSVALGVSLHCCCAHTGVLGFVPGHLLSLIPNSGSPGCVFGGSTGAAPSVGLPQPSTHHGTGAAPFIPNSLPSRCLLAIHNQPLPRAFFFFLIPLLFIEFLHFSPSSGKAFSSLSPGLSLAVICGNCSKVAAV